MKMINHKRFKIFSDFDGTISLQDVGDTLFKKFGDEKKAEEIITSWKEDEIEAPEMWRGLSALVDSFDMKVLEEFLLSIKIDPGFTELVKFCRENDLDFMILSDGFDYYINTILKNLGVSDLKIFSNVMEFGEKNEPIVSFPHTDEDCGKGANCKRNHILNNSGDDEFTFYIGDGLSDAYAAQFCDFIFAKDTLLKHCEKNRISYYPYKSFFDIKERITDLLQKKRLRKSHQAELKRKEIYMQG